ncbi:hypothetical protein M493_04460 [Geobacillus genomosp. 3]|uniref:DUF2642 domain-containing protein n=1 Tax=Geobacillus genomosp. 3 TaxID=1921421 RepID=S5Z2I0_GEOG3|nr:hypothetical protein [Geobacillus genomosp. 3]AGT31197.1 hypothetical protein M493_04460 [Geobacillus genomosp. 3]
MGHKRLREVAKELKKIRKWLEKLDLDDSTVEQIVSLLEDIADHGGDTERILRRILDEEQEQRAILEDERELLQAILAELRTGAPPVEDIGDELEDLIGERVEITVNFGPVAGTVIAVRTDYVVLEDALGRFVYVPFASIQAVARLD